jgi:plastocyanin
MRYGRAVIRSMSIRAVGALCSACILVAALAPAAQARPVLVRGVGTRWSPSAVSVDRGGVVKWRGISKYHDVIAYGGNWSFHQALPVGVTVKKRFRGTGTFRYRCTYHSTLIGTSCTGMCGSVRVTA